MACLHCIVLNATEPDGAAGADDGLGATWRSQHLLKGKTTMASGSLTVASIDLVIIVAYLVGIVALGLWAARKERNTSGDYFLAGRALRWPMIGLSLFATNISTVHLVGLASAGYSDGLVFGNFEWLAAFCLILLGVVFSPFYFRNGVTTLPEYLERRFSSGSRTALLDRLMSGRKPPKRPVYFEPRGIVTRQSTDVVAVDDPHVATVVRYIRDHGCDGISVTEALSQSPVSRSTLTRSFKRLLGRTPKAELARVQLDHAKRLLLETDLSMTEIAASCGFNEAKYFITVFHRSVGVTPLVFRRSSARRR